MQKLLILFAFLFIIQLSANSQTKNSIIGIITDSVSKKPVEYATITLFDAKTNKTLNGATTDSLGYFRISDVDSGLYNISFESIGYTAKTVKDIRIEPSHIAHNLSTISLHKNENTLQDVVVTSQTNKLIDNRIDKLVFNAENDITSQGGVASDVLKKVPQVSIDADGNVELAGNSGIRFLINGKPSTAFGSNIADVLQSIPASEIKSVEVITNPGARYDAQGMGGIINIILKKSRVNGVNGNVSITGGTRLQNGSFNITMRKNNFSVNAFASANTRLTATTPSASDRVTTDTINKQYGLLHQQAESRTNRYGIESGLGFDWSIGKYNSLSGNINYNRFGNSGHGLVNQIQQTTGFDNIADSTPILSNNNYNNRLLFYSTDANLNYIRKFAREDQTLEINLTTSLGNNNFRNNSYQTLLPQDSLYYGTNNRNIGKQNEYEVEINYTQPFTDKITFATGVDYTYDDITNTANVYALQPESKLYLYDTSVSNYLSYKQSVYALYAELSFPVGKLFNAKIGSRYERTEINSFYSNAKEQASTPGYNTFVPSAYILKKLTDNQTLKLSYSKRINRPDYEDLNPFINTTDPKNISAGNPYLKPEVGNRIELSYNHNYNQKGSFIITAFYRNSNHDIQPYTAFYDAITIGDSVYQNASVSTRENIGTEQNIGLSLFGNLKATDKFTLRTNLFAFRRHIINNIDSGNNPTSFNYRLNLNATYQFNKNFAAEMFGNFNSARNEIQGKYPSFTSYTIAMRKQFWNKKGSLALTANNIFSNYVKQKTILYGTNFTTNAYRKIPFRSIGLNFTYKFGKLEFKKDKNESNDDETPKENNNG